VTILTPSHWMVKHKFTVVNEKLHYHANWNTLQRKRDGFPT